MEVILLITVLNVFLNNVMVYGGIATEKTWNISVFVKEDCFQKTRQTFRASDKITYIIIYI